MSDLSYFIEIMDPFGVKLAQLDTFTALDYVRTINDVGVLTMDLPVDVPTSLFRKDARLSVWRQPTGGAYQLETGTVWFVRRWQRTLSEKGERVLRVHAMSALYLTSGRIVAYDAGTAYASKTDYADDMIKAIVRENLGSSATDSDRDWSDYLTVEADLSSGESLSKAFARRNVLTVLQEIAEASAEAGTRVYFDIVAPTSSTLEFRTYTGQRGTNRALSSSAPLIMSPELGNIASGDSLEDHSGEVTVVYAAGAGEGTDREVTEVEDATRTSTSPFGRREALRDARHGATGAALTAEGEAVLRESRPRISFAASLVDTPQARYGREWHWGDLVTVLFEGLAYDCHISTIRVTVKDGRETIQAALRAEVTA